MNASVIKRIFAYIIDMFIIALIISTIANFVPANNNLQKLRAELNETSQECLGNKIKTDACITKLANISYNIDKQSQLGNIINFVVVFLYFIILQYYNKGKTVGKYLMGIKIVKKDNGKLTLNDIAIRSLLVNAIAVNIFGILAIFITKNSFYFYTVTILGFLQIVLLITTTIMIMIRRDKRGIHDIITNTKVVMTR